MFGIAEKTFRVIVHMNSGKVHRITMPWGKEITPDEVKTVANDVIKAGDSVFTLSRGGRHLSFAGRHISCVEIIK